MIRLNASALPRVLACLGSTQFPRTEEVEQSEAAREGDAAHHAAECALKGLPIPDVAPNGYAIDAEMREHAADYAKQCHDGALCSPDTPTQSAWIEQRADFLATEQIEIACKVDAAWLTGDTLHVRDYKYGWRLVEAEGNSQLVAYAVGLIRALFRSETDNMVVMSPPKNIVLGIFQPRPYHPEGSLRTWPLTLDELIIEHNLLVGTLQLLHDPQHADKLDTGAHCEHCPGGVLGTCPAYLAATGNAIDVAMRGGPMDPTPAQVARELVTLERAAKVLEQRHEWLKDIAKRGLKAGTIYPGWALETQKGQTTWTIEPEALAKLTNQDVFQPRKLVTPAEAKRRGVDEKTIAENTTRPVIGDKLVRRDPDAYVRKKVGKGKKRGSDV